MYLYEIREVEYNLFFYLFIVLNICIVIGVFWERKLLIFDILGYFSFSFIKVYCNVSIFGKCCEKYEGGCCNVRFRFVSW